MSRKYGMGMVIAGILGMAYSNNPVLDSNILTLAKQKKRKTYGSKGIPQTKGKRQRSLKSRSNRSKAKRRVR
jgi:hypothetical protein